VNNRQAAVVLRDISPARIFARPTAEDLWLGPTRESVLSHLSAPGDTRVLLGPSASGRTTLLRRITHRTQDHGTTLRTPGPKKDGNAVLRDLLASAGLGADGLGTEEMRRLVSVYIREKLSRGRRVVLEVDDADDYEQPAWDELEHVRDSSRNGHSAELLLGLVHLDEASSPAASFVRGREAPLLGVVDWLRPREVSSYLRWRLGRFGLAELSTPSANRLIAHFTRGSFTTIDHLSQIALLLLRNGAGNELDVNVVCDAIRRLQRPHGLKTANEGGNEPARLIVSREGRTICTTRLRERMLIGRSRSNDLCLDSHFVSRHHAALVQGDRGYYLSDLNSVNGVFLNGTAVRQTHIADGDVLTIGPFRLKLRMRAEIAGDAGEDTVTSALIDTAVMPAPEENPEPAHLKVIK
jgi:general secretion pathway protein A